MDEGIETGDRFAGIRSGPDRARPPTGGSQSRSAGEPQSTARLEGEARDLRRILESVERMMYGLDEFTQRKVRILVGEVVAQAHYAGRSQRISLGLEIAADRVIVDVAGLETNGADDGGTSDSLLSEWSHWLVESITDGYSRSGDCATFVIARRRDP